MKAEDTTTYRLLRERGIYITLRVPGPGTVDFANGIVTTADRYFNISRALVYETTSRQKIIHGINMLQGSATVVVRKRDLDIIAKRTGMSPTWETVSQVETPIGIFEVIKVVPQARAQLVQFICRNTGGLNI